MSTFINFFEQDTKIQLYRDKIETLEILLALLGYAFEKTNKTIYARLNGELIFSIYGDQRWSTYKKSEQNRVIMRHQYTILAHTIKIKLQLEEVLQMSTTSSRLSLGSVLEVVPKIM
ncbi:hypothetical protein D3C76_03630 [compost metagenome]